jgi:predicted O-methyltransferase YrrM
LLGKLRYKIGIMRNALREPESGPRFAFPLGHPYSPMGSPEELRAREEYLWAGARPTPGIDFDLPAHRAFVRGLAGAREAYDYPDKAETGYYSVNDYFGWLDSRVLVAMMLQLRPRRIVEVGSGFSSLLMADVNTRLLGGSVRIVCIDPQPRTEILGTPGIERVINEQAQRLPADTYLSLRANDILFIDSSHVCKTDSDVAFLVLEILPRLAPGVIVHFHDVFIPFEYPKAWVIDENRSWNEQYVVQAFLAMNPSYEVLFGSAFAGANCRDELEEVFGAGSQPSKGGCSLWLRRRGA